MNYRLVATAGHVDHGKTSLLEALTGQQPDRLDEEVERGLTIDLGFADLRSDDLHLGFVDVPGHHNFIKNMVSGVGSVQGVLFVVSAVDGWQEQSAEHFEIINLIRPDYCCFVLTKTDLADDEMALVVESEVRDAREGTPYEESPLLRVSSETGEGLEALTERLVRDMLETPPPPDEAKPYCPVDRVFSLQGQGTVVTGSLSGGRLRTDDELVRMPDGEPGRVRSLQQYHRSSESVPPGSRVAINVPDWDREEVRRGHVAALRTAGTVAEEVDGRLETPRPSGVRVNHDRQVLAYLGTDRQPAQLLIEDQRSLGPSERALARLVWEEPVFARPGDRVVLRDFSDRRFLGCLTVAAVNAPDPLNDPDHRDWLRRRLPANPRNLLRTRLERTPVLGLEDLSDGTMYAPDSFLDAASRSEDVLVIDETWLASRGWWEERTGAVTRRVQEFHEEYPLRAGMPISTLVDRLEPAPVRARFLEDLRKRGILAEGDLLREEEFEPQPSGDQKRRLKQLIQSLNEAGLEAPDRDELASRFGEELLGYARTTDRLVQLSEERVIGRKALRGIRDRLRTFMGDGTPRRISEIRDCLDSSRKYVIPLMEYLDREGTTIRDGDVRYWRDEAEPTEEDKTDE